MWDNDAELAAARRRVDSWQATFTDHAVRAAELSRRLAGLRVVTRSTDRLVEVTLDSSGALVDLWLDERTRRRPAAEVAAGILETVRAARADLLQQVTETAAEWLGVDDPASQALISSYASRLATTEPGAPGGADPGISSPAGSGR